jgi:hypothetical protein
MVSIRCESATCFCDSEVQFHAGTNSYCSEHCAFSEPDAAGPCQCAHRGCEGCYEKREAGYAAAPADGDGPGEADLRSAR